MSRYKGRQSAASNERNYPHIVELPVPEGGLGTTLDLIAIFHANLGIEEHHGTGRYQEPRHYVRWCFADPQHARSVQALFGGVLHTG